MTSDSQAVTSPPTSPNLTRSPSRKTRSPSGTRFRDSLQGFVHRVKDVMSPSSDSGSSRRGRSPQRTASTGRGGAGNMVSSKSRDRAALDARAELGQGEQILKKFSEGPRSTGRGGAGNIRSPSRDPDQRAQDESRVKELEREEKAIEAIYEDRAKLEPIHVGRGGAGNLIH